MGILPQIYIILTELAKAEQTKKKEKKGQTVERAQMGFLQNAMK